MPKNSKKTPKNLNTGKTDEQVFRFALISIVLMLLLNVVSSFVVKGWMGAGFNTTLVSIIYFVYAAKARNAMLTNWLILSLTAGFVELLADWWLVEKTVSLVYADGPKLVVSPIYMPFAWMLVIVQVGLVGQWFARRFSPTLAALMTATLAGITIPAYESLAKVADWWVYQNTPMFMNAPYYIILGEFLIGLPLVFLGIGLAKERRIGESFALGVVEGLVILVAYFITWGTVG